MLFLSTGKMFLTQLARERRATKTSSSVNSNDVQLARFPAKPGRTKKFVFTKT